jgi:hypothetical protein
MLDSSASVEVFTALPLMIDSYFCQQDGRDAPIPPRCMSCREAVASGFPPATHVDQQ